MTDQAKQNKNAENLASFTAYCKAHPEERFWQALRNWSPWNFIYGGTSGPVPEQGTNLHDTFYDERIQHPAPTIQGEYGGGGSQQVRR